MGILAIIGLILIAVGILGLLTVIKISLAISIIIIVIGVLMIVFDNRARFTRP